MLRIQKDEWFCSWAVDSVFEPLSPVSSRELDAVRVPYQAAGKRSEWRYLWNKTRLAHLSLMPQAGCRKEKKKREPSCLLYVGQSNLGLELKIPKSHDFFGANPVAAEQSRRGCRNWSRRA